MGLEFTPHWAYMLAQQVLNCRQAVFRICTISHYSLLYLEKWVNLFLPLSPTTPFQKKQVEEEILGFELLMKFGHVLNFVYLLQKVLGHTVNTYYSSIHTHTHNGKSYPLLARWLPYTILKNVLVNVDIISCCNKKKKKPKSQLLDKVNVYYSLT